MSISLCWAQLRKCFLGRGFSSPVGRVRAAVEHHSASTPIYKVQSEVWSDFALWRHGLGMAHRNNPRGDWTTALPDGKSDGKVHSQPPTSKRTLQESRLSSSPSTLKESVPWLLQGLVCFKNVSVSRGGWLFFWHKPWSVWFEILTHICIQLLGAAHIGPSLLTMLAPPFFPATSIVFPARSMAYLASPTNFFLLAPWFIVLGPWFILLVPWLILLSPWFILLVPWFSSQIAGKLHK